MIKLKKILKEDNEIHYHSSYDNVTPGLVIRYNGTAHLQDGSEIDFEISSSGKRLTDDEIQSEVESQYTDEIEEGGGIDWIDAQED